MPKPQEMPNRRVDSVTPFQGRTNVERVADRRYHTRFDSKVSDLFNPEPQQTAYPGILEYEEPTVTVLLLQQYLRLLAKFSGDRRGVPTRIEGSPIVPRGSSGRENFVVQIHNALRLPIPFFVERVRSYQRTRQVAAEKIQDSYDRRRAAPMHAGNENSDSFRTDGVRADRFGGFCHRHVSSARTQYPSMKSMRLWTLQMIREPLSMKSPN